MTFYLDIQNDENITLQFLAKEFVFRYFNWKGTFNLSSDDVYRIPFVKNTDAINMDIIITYPNSPLSGNVYICEVEVIGKITPILEY